MVALRAPYGRNWTRPSPARGSGPWSGGRQTPAPRTESSDLVLEGLEGTDPDAARRGLRLDHDLLTRERVDALASLAGRLVHTGELRDARQRELAAALRLEVTDDVLAERLDDRRHLTLRELRSLRD